MKSLIKYSLVLLSFLMFQGNPCFAMDESDLITTKKIRNPKKIKFKELKSEEEEHWNNLMNELQVLFESKSIINKVKRADFLKVIEAWYENLMTGHSKSFNYEVYEKFYNDAMRLGGDYKAEKFVSQLKILCSETNEKLGSGKDTSFLPSYYKKIGIVFLKEKKKLKGQGLTVGVIDSGVEKEDVSNYHPSLPGKKFIESSHVPIEHGVSVSGIISAKNNNPYVQGIAPKVLIRFYVQSKDFFGDGNLEIQYYERKHPHNFISLKREDFNSKLDPNIDFIFHDYILPTTLDEAYAAFIDSCIKEEIFIINISQIIIIGPETVQAIKNFAQRGGIIISGAGNNNQNMDDKFELSDVLLKIIHSKGLFGRTELQDFMSSGHVYRLINDPEYCKAFLLVGSTNKEGNLSAKHSNRPGNLLTLQKRFVVAPGEDLPLLRLDHNENNKEEKSTSESLSQYKISSGTSYASPITTGGVILLYQVFQLDGITPQQIAEVVLATATPIGPEDVYGSGLVNFEAAYHFLHIIVQLLHNSSGLEHYSVDELKEMLTWIDKIHSNEVHNDNLITLEQLFGNHLSFSGEKITELRNLIEHHLDNLEHH